MTITHASLADSTHPLVFVYGTLLPGEPFHGALAGASPAGAVRTVPRFDLLHLGSFPALVTGGSTSIRGELYRVDFAVLDALDRIEGHPEFFRRCAIQLDDGREVLAYVLNPQRKLAHDQRIASGDWRAGRSAPPA